jgi:hypothetical protein
MAIRARIGRIKRRSCQWNLPHAASLFRRAHVGIPTKPANGDQICNQYQYLGDYRTVRAYQYICYEPAKRREDEPETHRNATKHEHGNCTDDAGGQRENIRRVLLRRCSHSHGCRDDQVHGDPVLRYSPCQHDTQHVQHCDPCCGPRAEQGTLKRESGVSKD